LCLGLEGAGGGGGEGRVVCHSHKHDSSPSIVRTEKQDIMSEHPS